MLTHTYPQKALRNISGICNHQAHCPLYVRLSYLMGFSVSLSRDVVHDAECPYCDQASLNHVSLDSVCDVFFHELINIIVCFRRSAGTRQYDQRTFPIRIQRLHRRRLYPGAGST